MVNKLVISHFFFYNKAEIAVPTSIIPIKNTPAHPSLSAESLVPIPCADRQAFIA
jgi:hypothetical protein